jgi:NADH:ubiquinone oxidoreductase subunit 3 (subunit A)
MPVAFSPPVAFAVYVLLVGILLVVAQALSAKGRTSSAHSAVYGSGEEAQTGAASPGYKPFFMVAFFFAILHLGVLIVGSGGFTVVTGVYILGLIFSLVALALG